MKIKHTIALALVSLFCALLFFGCNQKKDVPGGTNSTALEPDKIWAAIEEQIGKPGEAFPVFGDPQDNELFKNMYGISADYFDLFVWKVPLMNTTATEILIGKVKEGKMEEVKQAIEKRRNDLDDQWSRYLPAQYDLVKQAQVVENGNYILFAVSEHVNRIQTIFNESVK